MNCVKIISAIPGTPSMINEEVEKFLESKLLLQIGTIDDEAIPIFNPYGLSIIKTEKNF